MTKEAECGDLLFNSQLIEKKGRPDHCGFEKKRWLCDMHRHSSPSVT